MRPFLARNSRNATTQEMPSNTIDTPSTLYASQWLLAGSGLRRCTMPSYSETPAPIANTSSATMKLQKYSSRP